jgi:lipopolysaccharide export system permease protein
MNILSFPLIWRKILSSYLKGLTLAIVSIILILLSLKLSEIAHFATFQIKTTTLIEFTLYQIISILPFAIPIASFISLFLLTESLVETHELTAFRALGLSLADLFFPVFLATLFFAFLNFFLISEVSSQSALKINLLKEEIKRVNPLVLLQNKQLLKLKKITTLNLNPSKLKTMTQDTLFTLITKEKTPTLILTKELKSEENKISGKHLTLIALSKEGVMIENVTKSDTSTEFFPHIFRDEKTALKIDHLKFKELNNNLDFGVRLDREDKPLIQVNRAELFRRVSMALSVLTFSFLAISFSLSNQRFKTKKNLILSLFFIALYLVTSLVAKQGKGPLLFTLILFFAPQTVIFLVSFRKWSLFSSGKAS